MGVPMPGILRKNSKIFLGLYVQVGYKDSNGNNYYTTSGLDKMSLSQLSKKGEKEGWKKKGWS